MDVAPAAAEMAVVTGAVVQGACMQQYAAAAAWVQQQAACIGGAAGGGRQGHNCKWMAGSQHACGSGQRMWCACNSVQQSRVCATACIGSKRVRAASNTIAMEDSDGSRRRWRRKEQRMTATSC